MTQVYFQVREFQPKKYIKKEGKFQLVENNKVDDFYYQHEVDSTYKISRKQVKITFDVVIDMIHSQNIEFYDEKIEIAEQNSEKPIIIEKNGSFILNQNNDGNFYFYLQILQPQIKLKYKQYKDEQQVEEQNLSVQKQKMDEKQEDESESESFLFVTAKPKNLDTHLQTYSELRVIKDSMTKKADILISTQFNQIKKSLKTNKIEFIHFSTHIERDDKEGDSITLEDENYVKIKIKVNQIYTFTVLKYMNLFINIRYCQIKIIDEHLFHIYV
ncbi:hypothetical protein TTHERM_000558439 (macronuclear) [Tetrahymena thermophila SB210]|uniref:Uncharacterized protein n=1 Tax=Tetrahymena thermophila (strain SB210) TaxID=312017 RepID=W7XHV1_TETTS|nr:hypothetical protein TTHERM_000558439 [Tetrahymena thermophila SB210]EWS72749.1 hypothetical protein TTHERM_000558439 [Tetrahymena thermophila SB210]|eukprot:XP_012654727.1 hypothetical protein TTHERM_000558439 [Tetrahymena thermophila SB210]